MRFLLVLSLFGLVLSCNADTKSAAKTAESVTNETKKEEDCDDKAKKPIEIKEESISLTGNTGCTLDEAKPGI